MKIMSAVTQMGVIWNEAARRRMVAISEVPE